ncbi:MAG: Mur ligase domain-containing protein, partial [Bacillota bacterium]
MSYIKSLNKVHFIGAGGISLSALAKLMLKWGKNVSGSDTSFSNNVIELMELGADIWIGSDPSAIKKVDLAVYSSAIRENDNELSYCLANNIPIMERHIFLGLIAKEFYNTIAIGGTHGKTTCSAMLSYIMKESGKSFCGHIGGEVNDMGNLYYTGNRYFVTEACEYKKSLLSIPADIAVVLNAESDHPDTFSDLNDVYRTFDIFLTEQKNCLSLVCYDTDYYKNHFQSKFPGVLTFGTDINSTFIINEIKEYKMGY